MRARPNLDPEIVKTVTVQAYDMSLEALTGTKRAVKSLVDTGATRTVISARLAAALGARSMRNPVPIRGATGTILAEMALVAMHIQGRRCSPQVHLVAVSDTIADHAGFELVLGLDYQGSSRMAIVPFVREVSCESEPVDEFVESLQKFEDYFEPKTQRKPKPKSKPKSQRRQR